MPNKETKNAREAQNRAFGNDSKAERAHERRRRQKEEFKEFVEDFIAKGKNRTMNPRQLQEYRKGLLPLEMGRRLLNGVPTGEDNVDISEHERVVETLILGTPEKETRVTIVFVDAPHKTGIKRSKRLL